MDAATAAPLLLLLLSLSTCTATAAVHRRHRGADDEHVIITHYGPVRYDPVSEEDMRAAFGPRSGFYRAEVIPLDMRTWKPMPQATPVAARDSSADSVLVPMRPGYSVRPTVARRRRQDYGKGHRYPRVYYGWPIIVGGPPVPG